MEETYGGDERHYSIAMRKALDHPSLGRGEMESMLDLAAMMFEEAGDWVITVPLPKAWSVERPLQQLTNSVSIVIVRLAKSSNTDQTQLVLKFKAHYKTKPKEPVVQAPSLPPPVPAATVPAPIEPKRPAPMQKTSSIKINTHKAVPPQRPSVPPQRPSVATPVQSPKPGPIKQERDTIVASPVLSRQPSVSSSSGSKPSYPSEPSSVSNIKRPRPDKDEHHTPAPKRPKVEKPFGADSGVKKKKRRMVRLKVSPSRLASLMKDQKKPSINGRTSLPSGNSRDSLPPSNSRSDSITAKPARKPLPSGDAARRPLPGGPAGSPQPPPERKISLNAHSSSTPKPKSASPAANTPPPGAPPLTQRPKIKIIRKSNPPPPPAP